MNENSYSQDSLLEEFTTLEEAANFWNTHSLSDYWDETHEVEVEVKAVRRQWVPLASHVASRASERARREGVSVETLVNLWVAEHLEMAV
jgi:hypothetical protein